MDLYQIINAIGLVAGLIGVVFGLTWILADPKKGTIYLCVVLSILLFNVTIGLTLY